MLRSRRVVGFSVMRVYVVSFALGVWLLQRQAELPPLDWAWGLLALAPALALCRARARPVRHAGHAMLALCAFGAGFMWAAGMAHVRLADELPREWEARDIELIGVVASLPQLSDRSVRFDFDVEDVLTPSARVPSVRVSSQTTIETYYQEPIRVLPWYTYLWEVEANASVMHIQGGRAGR